MLAFWTEFIEALLVFFLRIGMTVCIAPEWGFGILYQLPDCRVYLAHI